MREHPPSERFCLSVTTAAAAASAEEVSWQPGSMSLFLRDSSRTQWPLYHPNQHFLVISHLGRN